MNHRRMPTIVNILSLFGLLIGVLLSVPNSAAAPARQGDTAFETMSLPAGAQHAPETFIAADKSSRPAKLDSALVELAEAALVSPTAVEERAEAQALTLSGNQVRVQVDIQTTGLTGIIGAIEAAGGEVTGVGYNETIIQAWLPPDALESVAAQPGVHLVRRPVQAHLAQDFSFGDWFTEGVPVINAPAWQQAGFAGAGVKVGIIDIGFIGYTSLLGTELPANVTVRNFDEFFESEDDVEINTFHGTAIAEIIHDIAPAADLYLASIFTLVDLQEAVQWLVIENEVDIISTSFGFYNVSAGDGIHGPLANLVRQARDAGVLWATSAGNDRETHWGGLYADPEGNNIHNFTGAQEVNYFGPGDGRAFVIPSGFIFLVYVRWDDWDKVDQDYDLYLTRWSGTGWGVVGLSDRLQNGEFGQTPTEVALAISTGESTAYGFFINRFDSNREVNFEIFTFVIPLITGSSLDANGLDERFSARSLANLADAQDAVTVAALDVNPSGGGEVFSQEPFSAEGPTNGPGGTERGGITKPDLAAFDNVSTVTFGDGGFAGTSAATPHVAGAAALVLSANPTFGPNDIQSYLEEQAIDLGSPGLDTQVGHGQLHLGDPPVAAASTLLYLSPPEPQITVGATEHTQVGVEDVSGLYELDFRLTFDPDLVQVMDADADAPGIQIEVDPLFSQQDHIVHRNQVDAGLVEFNATLLDPAEPINGSTSLASITWQGINEGQSNLTVAEASLKDHQGNPIAFRTQNSLVKIVPASDNQITGKVLLQGRTNHGDTDVFLTEEPCPASGQALEVIIPGTLAAVTNAEGFFEIEPFGGQTYQCLQTIQHSYLFSQQELPAGDLGTITLPGGDVTGDGVIDIFDLAFIASRYGSDDPTADVNANNVVDIFDLVLAANNFHQQGPVANWETVSGSGIHTLSSFSE